jgi:histidinol phosphatase-like PHP family hydrolase
VDYVVLDGERIAARVPPAQRHTAAGLTSRVVGLTIEALETEPVDVYGGATFLPGRGVAAPLSEEQRKRIIDAAVRNQVAIEINGRLGSPDEAFVRAAKAAGAKFTFGECALRTPAGDYCFDLREKVGLSWRDIYQPGHVPARGAVRKH